MARITDHLRKDHVRLKALFAQYEYDPASKFAEIKELLELHTEVEEKGVYPASKSFAKDEVEHAKKEHDKADKLLANLEKDPTNIEAFHELRDAVLHHIEEEELEYFPLVEEHLDEEKQYELDEEADRMADEK